MITFILGMVVGAMLGIIVASLCKASALSDLAIRNCILEEQAERQNEMIEQLRLKYEKKNDDHYEIGGVL